LTSPSGPSQIYLDATNWRISDDFYLALLPKLGAPGWHGHNLDALWDTLTDGQINQVNPPLEIFIRGMSLAPFEVHRVVVRFSELMVQARREGVSILLKTDVAL
jgi:RNAse (barnase) inhibitor barstar